MSRDTRQRSSILGKKQKRNQTNPGKGQESPGSISSVQFTQSCPTLCDPMDCSKPGFPVFCYLLEFSETHVHWVGDAIQQSHPHSTISTYLRLLIFLPAVLIPACDSANPSISHDALYISSVQFSRSVVPNLCNPMDCKASLPITNSWSLLKFMSVESVMPSNHLNLCCPLFLLPLIFPSIRDFSNESVLHIRLPKYWSSALASRLPMNSQNWFPLG